MLGLFFGRAAAQLPIPPVPEGGAFTSDLAGLLHEPDISRIGAAQRDAWQNQATPIIVVTIPSMGVYGHTGSIEEFAAKWFNTWGIGSGEEGKNKGILVMVSVGDRKARIELGASWGRDWDDHCKRIMDGTMIPAFKRGGYSDGIAAGVEELARMAGAGVSAPAPAAPGFVERTQTALESKQPVGPASPFPLMPIVAMVGFGILLIIGSFFAPENMRNTMLVAGVVLILFALFFWILIFVLFLIAKFRGGGGGRSGWSGGFSSGDGFSGGSSGGGGASGSW